MNDTNKELRNQLLALLRSRNAHLPLDKIVAGFPPAYYNSKFSAIPYSAWELLEHMRITQWDILEFIRNPHHVSPEWPKGYWPSEDESADENRWNETLSRFNSDLKAVETIAEDPETDFFKPLDHAPDYTIFREILLVADHNAYHTGQLVVLKRLLKII